MITKEVVVTICVEVTVDEAKFTEVWMADWRDTFYPFKTVDDHIRHIAQLTARGEEFNGYGRFVEGYGDQDEIKSMGITAKAYDWTEDIVS